MSNHSGFSVRVLVGLVLLFVSLGLADLWLTWRLIQMGDGQVIESNPVADWWLATYGWGGMVAFKVGMILVAVGLSATVAWWRPRTGEFILVFSCGAQTAVVLYSVFLLRLIDEQGLHPGAEVHWFSDPGPTPDPGGGPPHSYGLGFLPENGRLLLLGRKPVQDELQLSEAEVETITQLAGKRQELRLGYRGLNREEWNVRVRQLLDQEKALVDGLGPEQAGRLRQISWQQRGLLALGDPEVGEALQLSAEQKGTIARIMGEAQQARGTSFRFRGYGADTARMATNDMSRTTDQLATVLSADQAVRWKEMLGEPFKGDLTFRPPSRPGYGPPGFGRYPGRPQR